MSSGAIAKALGVGSPKGYEEPTISTSASGLDSDQYEGAHYAIITVEDAAIRWRIDGGDPTGTSGHKQGAGSSIELHSAEQIQNFSAIRADSAGADATLRATYIG